MGAGSSVGASVAVGASVGAGVAVGAFVGDGRGSDGRLLGRGGRLGRPDGRGGMLGRPDGNPPAQPTTISEKAAASSGPAIDRPAGRVIARCYPRCGDVTQPDTPAR